MSSRSEKKNFVFFDEFFEGWSVGEATSANFAHFQDATVLQLGNYLLFLHSLRNLVIIRLDASKTYSGAIRVQ